MAQNKKIDADQFNIALEEILGDVFTVASGAALVGVQTGVRVGGKLWRKHAKDAIGEHTYKRSGETITSGKYARSISGHMLSTDELHPEGEIGSRKLAGLTHLLQDGHARVGGGRVNPVLKLHKAVSPGTREAAIAAAESYLEHEL